MSKRKGLKDNSLLQLLAGFIAIFILAFVGKNSDINLLESLKNSTEINPLENVESVDNSVDKNIVDISGNLEVDFVDVGQGDSILITQGEYTMLIDGGTTECKDVLLEYLQDKDIDKFEYIIGTHPHEDHIGSLDDVVNAYDFDTILFPKVTTTTKTFENLALAVQDKQKTFINPQVGTEYSLGDAKFQILAPNNNSYTSLNNYSIVIKLTYGENTFIFTGDAETIAETEILQNADLDLKADVLKVGHHGSTTSTSKKFLDAVSPKYAVLCVGKDNSYNHPTKTTMDKLSKLGVNVYRTDEQGTIECVSDGKTITFNVEPGSYNYMQD